MSAPPALLHGLAQPLTPAEEYAAFGRGPAVKRIQRVMLAGIRRGEISPAEVGEALGISRQTVYRWSAGIDVERARKQYVQRLIKAAMEAEQ